jgi:hypothetical protein
LVINYNSDFSFYVLLCAITGESWKNVDTNIYYKIIELEVRESVADFIEGRVFSWRKDRHHSNDEWQWRRLE